MDWKILTIGLLVAFLLLSPTLTLAQEASEGGEEPTPVLISAGTEVETDTDIEDPGILPDSPFYGFKLFGERIQMMFTFNEKAKLKFKLKLAERRLSEAERMMLRNKTQIMGQLMDRYQAMIQETEQDRERLRLKNITVDDVDEWMNMTTNKHIYVLRRVLQRAPDQAKTGLQRAIDNAEANRIKIRERLIEKIEIRERRTTTTTSTTTTTTLAETNETETETNETNETIAAQSQRGRTLITLVPI